jgi:hypothetical protein
MRFVSRNRRFVASRWEREIRLSTFTPNAPGAPRQKEPIMTTDNIFSAVLTLSLLAGGAVAFGSDAASKHAGPAKAETAVVTLPTVTVVGRRAAPTTLAAAERVTLPTVTVVGRRTPTEVAVGIETVEHRVQ